MINIRVTRNINNYVGKRISILRRRFKITQTKLAEICGVSFQQIQKYEKGVNKISIDKLNVIAKAFNISMAYFLPPEKYLPNNNESKQEIILNEQQSDFNNESSANKLSDDASFKDYNPDELPFSTLLINEELQRLMIKINRIKDKEKKAKIIQLIENILK